MTSENYHLYTEKEFLNDPDFLRYIKYRNGFDVAFWENWQKNVPSNLSAFVNAKFTLEVILGAEGYAVPENFQQNLLSDINDAINQIEKKAISRRRQFYYVSGVAVIILFLSGIFWFSQSIVTITTGYAENRIIRLPEGTEIRLNANSTLSYPRAFVWKSRREVKLDGEAYFKVKHLNHNPARVESGEVFIATTRAASVQVLGTDFNIKERRGKTDISLLNGKIKITSIKTGNSYIMKPGQSISLDKYGHQELNSSEIDSQIAWLSGKFVVSQTSVNEILREFEDLYGYRVFLENKALGEKKIDGSISIKNEESLLFTLKNILNVDIEKQGKVIYLKNRR